MTSKEFFTVTRSTFKQFNKDDLSLLSAGVTYYAFFSIFPLLMLSITLAGIFFRPQDASEFIFNTISKYAPGSTDLLAEVMEEAFTNRSNAGWLALIGFLTLIFTASNAFGILDRAINRAWSSEKVPNFIVAKLASFGMMLVTGALLILSVIISVVLSAARNAANYVAGGEVPGSNIFWQLLSVGVSLGVVFLSFLLLYRYLPRCDVRWRDVWLGALLAAIIWVLLKELFALFVSSPLANFSATYGPIAAVIVLLTWIYLSSLIILTGAEFTSETYRVRRLRFEMHMAAVGEKEIRESPWFSRAS